MKKLWAIAGALLVAASMWAQTSAPSIPEGTSLNATLQTTISTFNNRVGDPFKAKLTEPVLVDGKQFIPVGAIIEGRVIKLSGPRRIKGKPTIGLFPENIVMPDGQRYMLNAVLVDTSIKGTAVNEEGFFKGKGHDRSTHLQIAGGTGAGMLMGGLIGGGAGVLIGGAVGAGATTTYWLVQHRTATMPSGTRLTLELSRPMTMSSTAAVAGQ